MMPSPESWVAIGFIVFLCVLAYLGAYRKLVDRLDERQSRIRAELEEASRLRAEARSLLAEIERKELTVRSEADAIISAAKAEVERLADEAQLQIADFITRRKKMADAKIAQVEAQALADVRGATIDAAIAAAEKILRSPAVSYSRNSLISTNIRDVREKLDNTQLKIALDAAE
jgi:F-type H+-transporting ATPase subunit b